MPRILKAHREYLADESRVATYLRALRSAIQPGDIVIDLGCGSGILGLLACRAGAGRVYAIDSGGIIQLARSAARDNGLGHRIEHIRGRSTDVWLPERADAVVCDQLGPLGFDAGLLECYDDARRRLLKPAARMIPSVLTTWFAPAESFEMYSAVDNWLEPRAGFRFDAFRKHAVNTVHRGADAHFALLAPGAPAFTFDLSTEPSPFTTMNARWTVQRAGTLHGLAGWFVAELAPGVLLTNAPGEVDRIDRKVAFLPIETPVLVADGDSVLAEIQLRPMNNVVTWRVEVQRGGETVAAFDHTTLRSVMFSSEDFLRAPRERRVSDTCR